MSIERNLSRYQLYATIVHTPLFVPVVVLFWTANGLTLLDVYLLQTAYAAGVVLLEVPTGVIADRVGKRTSLLLAAALFAVSLVYYGLSDSFGAFLAAELGLALAGSLMSGADVALLYDSLHALGREGEFQRWSGRSYATQQVSFAVANVLGGIVGAWSLRATLLLSAVGPVLAWVAAVGLVEVRPPAPTGTIGQAVRGFVGLLGDASRFVWRHQRVRWLLAMFAVLTGSATWLLWSYQPYFELVGLPVWSYGLVMAGYNLFAAAASASAHRVSRALGETRSLIAVAVLQLLPLPLMASLVHPASVLFVLGQQAVRGIGRPLISDAVLAHTWADKRATVLSLAGLGTRLFFVLTGPVVGVATDRLTLPQALSVQALLLAALFAALAVAHRRIPAKFRAIKPDRSVVVP